MCARYALSLNNAALAALFAVPAAPPPGDPRFNIAPSQPVPAILPGPQGWELRMIKWGFLPSWAKDAKRPMVNARSETILEKPTFRSAFQRRRCLLPADGFYEWQTVGKDKQPFLFERPDKAVFGFAGIWERWTSNEGEAVDTTCMLTTGANSFMAPIHDRMPVMLGDRDAWGLWLDPKADAERLLALLVPAPEDFLNSRKVSRFVSNSRNEGVECQEGG